MTGTFEAPTLDYAALSPLIALAVGLVAIVLTAVFRPLKRLAPGLAILSMAVAAGCLVWQFGTEADLVSGSLRIDGLSTTFSLLILIAGIVAVLYAAGDIAGTLQVEQLEHIQVYLLTYVAISLLVALWSASARAGPTARCGGCADDHLSTVRHAEESRLSLRLRHGVQRVRGARRRGVGGARGGVALRAVRRAC